MSKNKESFETILENLEVVVRNLEKGDLPLEEALEQFERGIGLSRRGAKQLEDAEHRIEQIMENGELKNLDEPI